MVPWWVAVSVGLIGLIFGVVVGIVAGASEPPRFREDGPDCDGEK